MSGFLKRLSSGRRSSSGTPEELDGTPDKRNSGRNSFFGQVKDTPSTSRKSIEGEHVWVPSTDPDQVYVKAVLAGDAKPGGSANVLVNGTATTVKEWYAYDPLDEKCADLVQMINARAAGAHVAAPAGRPGPAVASAGPRAAPPPVRDSLDLGRPSP